MFAHQAQRKVAHDLKAGEAGIQVFVGQAQQLHRSIERGHGRKRGELRSRHRVHAQGGSGDHTQRAFGANKQVAQVVAGVVFAQAGQAAPDFALRRHHLQAQAQLAGVAVAHHLGAAGIGGQVAANGAAAFGGQAQGEQKAFFLARLLQGLQHAAGLYRHGEVGRVDGADAVQALQAQQYLGAGSIGDRAHHHAGVAALRHQAHTGCRAGFDHCGNLFSRAGAHHGQGVPALAFAPVLFVSGEVALGEYMRFAHEGAQGGAQGIAQSVSGSHTEGEGGWVVLSGAGCKALPAFSRKRIWKVQATNSTMHSATSIKASQLPGALSLQARTTPSVKYSHTIRLSHR